LTTDLDFFLFIKPSCVVDVKLRVHNESSAHSSKTISPAIWAEDKGLEVMKIIIIIVINNN